MCMHQQQRNQVHKRVLASHKVFRQIWYKNVLDSILTAFTKQFFHHWQAPIRFSHFFRVRHPQTICGRAGTKPNQTIFFAVYPVSLGNRHSTQTFSGCREKRENGPTRHWKWEIVHRCTFRLDKAFVQTNPDKHFWITKKNVHDTTKACYNKRSKEHWFQHVLQKNVANCQVQPQITYWRK